MTVYLFVDWFAGRSMMKMTYRVFMTAFGCPGDIRDVDIPEIKDTNSLTHEGICNIIYKYGQNDFQPKPYPSVSMGDIIEIPTMGDPHYFVVVRIGFKKLSQKQMMEFMHSTQRDRRLSELLD